MLLFPQLEAQSSVPSHGGNGGRGGLLTVRIFQLTHFISDINICHQWFLVVVVTSGSRILRELFLMVWKGALSVEGTSQWSRAEKKHSEQRCNRPIPTSEPDADLEDITAYKQGEVVMTDSELLLQRVACSRTSSRKPRGSKSQKYGDKLNHLWIPFWTIVLSQSQNLGAEKNLRGFLVRQFLFHKWT